MASLALCRDVGRWAVLLWPAIGPWGLGTALQAAGQRSCSSSQTQLLLATDPLWATLFAGLLGSSEQMMDPFGFVGGAAIVAGAVTAGVGSVRSDVQEDTN